MRLTKPTLGRANLVNLDGRDVDGLEDPYSITNTNDANIINNTPYECNSPAMLLPQNFGYVSECFRIENAATVIKLYLNSYNYNFVSASGPAAMLYFE